VAISIASYAVAAGSIAWIIAALTGSRAAAAAGVAVFALNPNVLYLQATPMTEPLLLATTTLAVAMLLAWCETRASLRGCHVGWAFALACLTRYEAWPVTVSALVAAAWVRWRRAQALPGVVRDVAAIAVYPALAIAGFFVFSRVVVGAWFLSGGFFVPENNALGDPQLALKQIGWGVRTLSGPWLAWIGAGGVAVAAAMGVASRRRSDALIVLSLVAMAAIPWVAFLDGHPFRIRYMVPLMAAQALGGGILAGLARQRTLRAIVAVALVGVAASELRPLDPSAPMVVEAQWDRPNLPVRARVTGCIGAPARGVKIMASMGSLGHHMQEASRSGFAVRDFLHEGNGDIWLAALEGPRPFAEWLLIEEKAEGGDMLAQLARATPAFLDGYTRVCEGAGLVLYRRD
jgi:hypothetical protein